MNTKKKRDTFFFYVCISPWLIGFFGLTIGPMLYSLYGAMSSWDGVLPPNFIGLKNFTELLTSDSLFLKATINTFYYAAVSVPTSILFALFLAFLLSRNHRAAGIFQAIFYFPSICAGIAVYMIWIWLFNGELGAINYFLSLVGIRGPNWLADPAWAMPSMFIMNLTFCGSQMLIFIAGLKQIPAQYYEAAIIDGAGSAQMFRKITLPLLSPVVLFNTVMGMIGAFQVFGQPLILTGGGPMQATYVYGLFIYKASFYHFKFGYAAAASWILFAILMVLSLLVMKISASRINYEM